MSNSERKNERQQGGRFGRCARGEGGSYFFLLALIPLHRGTFRSYFWIPIQHKMHKLLFSITSERTLYYHKTIWKTINNNLYKICGSNKFGHRHIAAKIFIRLRGRLFRAFYMYVTFSAFPDVNLYTNSRDKLKQGAHGKLAGPRGTSFRIKQNTYIWIYGPFRHQKNKKSNKQTDKNCQIAVSTTVISNISSTILNGDKIFAVLN